MHTLKKILLSSVPKLILKMAAFALTSQISELDNFNLETSFEDFVMETQHKLMSISNVQSDEEAVAVSCDLSSFMSINFDAAGQEPPSSTIPAKEPYQVLQEVAETVLTDELSNQVVKDMGNAIFGDAKLSPVKERELLFQGVTEEDAAFAVVHQDGKFSAEELVCLEVLENGFLIKQEKPFESFTEENFNYTDHSFSYTEDGVTVVKSVVPSVLSLKKSMACKQAIRTAIDSRLRQELEDFSIPKKACKKRSIIMQGWRSNDPNNPFAKARDQFLDEMFDEILDISTRIENSEYGFLASKKRK